MKERIGVVVNSHELFKSSKERLAGQLVCYNLLMKAINGDRTLVEGCACMNGSVYYDRNFLQALNFAGLRYEKVVGDDFGIADFFAKKIIDIAPTVDTIVLVTKSDSITAILDYLDETERLPKVELWFFKDDISKHFADAVDEFHQIDDSFIYQRN